METGLLPPLGSGAIITGVPAVVFGGMGITRLEKNGASGGANEILRRMNDMLRRCRTLGVNVYATAIVAVPI